MGWDGRGLGIAHLHGTALFFCVDAEGRLQLLLEVPQVVARWVLSHACVLPIILLQHHLHAYECTAAVGDACTHTQTGQP